MPEIELKDLTNLSPKERVKLYIKDAHYRKFLKKSILTNYERQNILLPDYETKKEYKKLSGIYQKTPLLMGAITEAYLRFKKESQTLLSELLILRVKLQFNFLIKINNLLRDIIKNEISEISQKWDILIKTLEEFLKEYNTKEYNTSEIGGEIIKLLYSTYDKALNFISLQRIVERVNKELGFNVFEGKPYKETFKNYTKDILGSIKKQNEKLNQFCLDFEKIATLWDISDLNNVIEVFKKYIISEEKLKSDYKKTNLYKEWSKLLFKDSGED